VSARQALILLVAKNQIPLRQCGSLKKPAPALRRALRPVKEGGLEDCRPGMELLFLQTFVEANCRRDVMVTPSLKRPGSPIGRTRPRKANRDEVRDLRAKHNTPTGVLSLKLRRPEAAIRSKAQREGISLKPVNRSPYNRRKSA
jgi:hypothetical protein